MARRYRNVVPKSEADVSAFTSLKSAAAQIGVSYQTLYGLLRNRGGLDTIRRSPWDTDLVDFEQVRQIVIGEDRSDD